MPSLSEEQLAAAIPDGTIGAVTLDTSVFDQFNCNLGYKALRSLEQFKGTQVAVVFSDVIAGEVRAHIRRDAETTASKLRTALNHYGKAWRRGDFAALAAGIDLGRDATTFGQTEWDAFVQAVGAQMIAADGLVSIAELPPWRCNLTSGNSVGEEIPNAAGPRARVRCHNGSARVTTLVSAEAGIAASRRHRR